ncbi:MAG: GNAT family N-acetyltransferase [Candidatus Thalassarchaeaceae archaeon]|tara:strand:+ start:1215 stop:1700 length:486 start_codon:yes stop_codon:yes gene_type:complete
MVSSVELPDIVISIASIQHLDDAVRCWDSLVVDQNIHDSRISPEALSDSEKRQFLRSVILDGRLIMALDSSRLVGIATIAVENNMLDNSQSVWNISDVWVDVNYRRRGIGIQLVNECEIQAKSKGASEIRLQVYSTNQPASMMYGRLGYRSISRMMSKKLD